MRVYVLQQFDPRAEPEQQLTILNCFATHQAALDWRNNYIAQEFNIEPDFAGDITREAEPTEFFISSYQVLS